MDFPYMKKPAFGFPRYELDTDGRITDMKSGKPVSIRIYKRCPEVLLSNGLKICHVQFARLMLKTFNPCGMSELMEVHHVDRDPMNNSIWNLLWVLPSQHDEIHRLINNQRQPYLPFFISEEE